MTNNHTHTRKDELHVFFIPADTDQKMEMKVVSNTWQGMADLVGGYIEVVTHPLIPDLYCGCQMVLVVNEMGLIQRLPVNLRASIYYPASTGLRGDVFLVGQGLVETPEETSPDLFSLPQALVTWEGPGNPLPTQKQPWELDG